MWVISLLATLIISVNGFFSPTMPRPSVGLCASDSLSAQILSKDIAKEVNVPMIPKPIVAYLVSQAMDRLSTDLSQDSMARLQELVRTQSTGSKFDDLSLEDRDKLADQIANELNPRIDVPMLNEEQELMVLQKFMRVLFREIKSSSKEDQLALLRRSLQSSGDLLNSSESRQKLVQTLNTVVDIPFLDENQQEKLLRMAVDASASTLQSLLPSDLLDALQGESKETIDRLKNYTVTTVSKRVNFVGLDEEQVRQIIATLVDVLVDYYMDGTESDYAALTPKEQLEILRQQRKQLKLERDLSKRRYKREQRNLKAQRRRVNQRIKETKQNMGFFGRFFG